MLPGNIRESDFSCSFLTPALNEQLAGEISIARNESLHSN